MKFTNFKNRKNPSNNDDQISWLKGYNEALKDATKNLKVRWKLTIVNGRTGN